MATKHAYPSQSCRLIFFLGLTVITLLASSDGAYSLEDRKMYIVYMGEIPKGDFSASSLHNSMLEQIIGSDSTSDSWVYSYKKSFNGFVAKLTKEEVQKMAGMKGVVSVFPNTKKKLHTTRSWDFMGFTQQAKRTAIESDVIVGVLDTGIWPESDSFNDDGFSPPPTKWKGICQASSNFTCNNKIIGARYYYTGEQLFPRDIESPRDSEGHGSHTSSIAAGRQVSGASMMGLGLGTARGGVPLARIAVYKICWSDGCSDADILAAFDDAISDGVDIISLSVGGFPMNYFEDSIAIGAFHSMKNGILTSNSAGNDGPDPQSVTNISPWSLTVAASTIDREFITKAKLGNGDVYEGISVNTFDLEGQMYPLIYGEYCEAESLNASYVKGKILLCGDLFEVAEHALAAGAVGTIISDGGISYTDVAFTFPLPATYLVSPRDGTNVSVYLNSTRNPTASILKTTEVKNEISPSVVSFSSRGPSTITSDILKPDLTAPGVDIVAAWSPIGSVSGSEGDPRVVSYNIESGTSMSCPHATAAAAYIKSFHPTWSPAAIKSALMTTAYPMSDANNKDAEFSYGSGHINPEKAINPGLVYDADEADYVRMLCGQGYDTETLQLITGDSSTCTTNGTVWDMNYPSFALTVNSTTPFTQTFHRTITNVGSPGSIYIATMSMPSTASIKIHVAPSTLSFKSLEQQLSFVVTVSGIMDNESGSMISASLTWDDGVYYVRSPIVVSTAYVRTY